MQEIDLKLTIDETNLVLEGLGQLPFGKVYSVVAKIQAQASGQIKPRGPQGGEAAAPPEGDKSAN